ncbi:non-ribosomal peptide synthase/polyketide synthase [Archangium violaceum]|uniref:non-ribosomal peptide synthase/polyketide synthase n=1 Tax=Archangium violaceum TaxID=83451 RepID=UPI00195115A4|nr:non-ribosomal peptide synthase/polyketide synthase [Archangium violaceum]QRO01038.1 non-ribosomal peptide synthase/polyketide synthase [Archangium violaceum]
MSASFRRISTHHTLVELLEARASERPGERLYTFVEEDGGEPTLTYGELELKARRIAAALQARARAGDRVMLLYPPGLEYVAGFFGCLYAGMVAVPAYPPDPVRLERTLPRLRAIIQDAQATVVLSTSFVVSMGEFLFEQSPDLAELQWVATDELPAGLESSWRRPETGPDSLTFLQYTSGSTGTPKGVMLSHRNLLHNLGLIAGAFGAHPGSVGVIWLPPYHDMGLIGGILEPLYMGFPVTLLSPLDFLKRPSRWLEAISRHRATISGGPNFAFDLCVRKMTPEQRRGLDLSSWQVAFSGAEPIRPETLARFTEAFGPCGFRREAFYPCYGLAEGSLIVSGGAMEAAPVLRALDTAALEKGRAEAPRDGGQRTLVGCGRTLEEQRLLVVDPESRVACPPGRVGEIWVSGSSVAQGYWRKPEATEEVFLARTAEGDGPFLRTGDLGFLQEDGELFVTGRRKDLIILRGRNHYPQDLELTVEQAHPALRQGCGAAFSVDVEGQERLVVVQEIDLRGQGDLRRQLLAAEEAAGIIRQRLAEGHEVQLHALALIEPGSLPKTSSGKVQRHATRAAFLADELRSVLSWREEEERREAPVPEQPRQEPPAATASRDVPTTQQALESWLVSRLAARLRVRPESVRTDEPVTRYGLDSLAAVELTNEIETGLGVVLPMEVLLQGPTIAGLARRLAGGQGSEVRAPLSRRPREGGLPLSFSQQRLWFFHQLEPSSPLHNIPTAVRLSGALDLSALERSFAELVRRHETLRTTLADEGGVPVQLISPAVGVRLPVVDLSTLPEAAREAEARRLADEEAREPFDLARGPLLRTTLLRMGEREHVLLLTVHHIVSDGWSMGVLVREVAALYEACSSGRAPALAELPVQYVDFAAWQREWLCGRVLESQLSYWRKQLEGVSHALELPTDRPRPSAQSFRGASLPVRLPAELSSAVRELSRREGVTPFMVLLAAFEAVLHRYSGQEDFCVGSAIVGRSRRELEGLIGFFANTLVLRARVAGGLSFRELLGRTRDTTLGAYAHQDMPFDKLVEALQPEREPGRSPLFQVMFVLQQDVQPHLSMPGLSLRRLDVDTRTAQFDLALSLTDSAEGFSGFLEYSTDLFDAGTMERLAVHLCTLLEGAVSRPELSVSALPLLPPEERHRLLVEWSGLAGPAPDSRLVLELFAEQVAARPDADALDFEGQRLTYRELDVRANQLAHHLRSWSVGPDVRVGLCVERSLELVVGMLGILKAGGAFVPLDPVYPAERLAFMLQDSVVPVLLTQRTVLDQLPREHGARVLCLDSEWARVESLPREAPVSPLDADNLAYVIYTSGSTGRPKGVLVVHRSLGNESLESARLHGCGPGSRMLQFSSLSFDISVWEVFGALVAGACVVLAPRERLLPGSALGTLLKEQRITAATLTPMVLAQQEETGLEALSTLISGGDVCTPEVIRRWKPGRRFLNAYGPTEITICATIDTDVDAQRPSIGRPLRGMRVYVLDPALRPAPSGVPGELYVGGVGVARGYLGRPELTAERFVPDPFSADAGARMYRTGDRVRFLADGRIEYLGRLDGQVKVRGIRIEPGEVEAVLKDHPAVREVAVVPREDVPGDRRLVAYVVPRPGQDSELRALRSWLKGKLPEALVPSAFVPLEALPLNPNGKLDRKALPAPDRLGQDAHFVAPRTPVEEMLAGQWTQLLGVTRVSSDDDFFALGGHSLLATQALSRLRAAFGVEVSLRELFATPTVAGLAERIEALLRARQSSRVPPLRAAPRQEAMPLSFAQQRLWFLQQLEPDGASYNMPAAVRMRGTLDVAALERSLGELLRRHEVLRTTFRLEAGQPVQSVSSVPVRLLARVDLGSLPESSREDEVRRLSHEEARRPFDLTRGPLLRATLLRLDEQEHVLLVTLHHIVSDGWSTAVLVREVAALYEAFLSGRPSPLPELPVQYADYAVWQRSWLQGEVLESQLAFWRQQLEGAPPVLELPTDRPRSSSNHRSGASLPVMLPSTLASALRSFSQREGSTVFMTLLAGFQVLLSRYSGQKDIVVGTDVANRHHAETEGLIGFFVNQLVMRTRLEGNPSFREVLAQVRESALGAYAHQDLPFEELVRALNPERSLAHAPLFQVKLVLQNVPDGQLELPGLSLDLEVLDSGAAKLDMVLLLSETERGLEGTLDYDASLFEPASMERLVGHLRTLLEAAVANPGQRVSALPLLTEEEQRRVLEEWNATEVEWPREKCIHELVTEQARARPEAVAVSCEGQKLTYRELEERANKLGNHLRGLGVGPEVRVALSVERSLELVVGMLGILKAGGVYVPLEPSYPAERLAYMMRDAGVSVVLTQEHIADELPAQGELLLCLDTEWAQVEAQPAQAPESGVRAENLAYIIYTSGSTGRPKGVMLGHRGLCNTAREAGKAHGYGPESRVLQYASMSFDASVCEVFGALVAGASLVLAPKEKLLPGEALGGLLRQEGITAVTLTPSVLAQQEEEGLEGLGTIISAGEACTPELVRRWGKGRKLLNAYGPTEVTVCATITSGSVEERVTVGRAWGNVRVYVLDEAQRPVPVGVAGELYVGGEGLARGYVGRAELTAERFVPDGVSGRAGERLYRTGDKVRWAEKGELEYLGRLDEQVKVRGMRVELGEVEAVLMGHPAVREAAVAQKEDAAGNKRLVGYVVPRPGQQVEVGLLRAWLGERLPEHQVPSAWVVLETLPLSTSGKVDKKALPAPDGSRPEQERPYVAPRTSTERQLAEVWAPLLGLDRVGVDDDFFELGGHSLLATQAISRISALFGVELPLRELFEAPTVARLAVRLEAELQAGRALRAPALLRVERTGSLPLSFAQQRLWFLDRMEPGSPLYNNPAAVRLDGPLDVAALDRAFQEIVRRHEALRTLFQDVEGQPAQVIVPSVQLPLPVVDLRELPEPSREEEARRISVEEARQPFDLTRGPLLRALLLALGEHSHVLLLTMHHIVSDGWSTAVLIREVAALYEAFHSGRPSPLPELPVQYADYSAWQRSWLQGDALEAQLAYWRQQLAGAPSVLELPTDRPRPAVQSFRGTSLPVRLPRELSAAVRELSRREGVTSFMTLLAAFQTVLSRYSGQDDVCVGSPIAGRTRSELEGLIGLFINTLVLRTKLSSQLTFRELLARVRTTTLDAYAHQDVPFEKLVEELKPVRSLSHSPLFQVLFILQQDLQQELKLPGLSLHPLASESGTARFDLTLNLMDLEDGFAGTIDYSTDLYDAETMERLFGHVRTLLEAAVAEPDRKVGELPLLTAQERERVLEEWNQTGAEYPRERSIGEEFEERVKERAGAVALECGEEKRTYGELEERANQIAHYLRGLGVGADERVGLCVERSAELVEWVLGIVKAGGAYVPLDPAYPRERLAGMLEDARPRVVVTEREQEGRLPLEGRVVVVREEVEQEVRRQPKTAPRSGAGPRTVAYVDFTSGSTGRPKGVLTEHRGVLRTVKGAKYAHLGPEETLLLIAPISFDASTLEVWGALLNGARLVVYPRGPVGDVEELERVVKGKGVTVLHLTAGLFTQVVDTKVEGLRGVRQVLTGGDVVSAPHVRRVLEELKVPVTACYGPTENTLFTSCHRMERVEQVGEVVAIGRPIGNTRVYVLDEGLQPVPVGVVGELYTAGEGLARGYLEEAGLTAEKFMPDPYGGEGERMYRTGDMARWRKDGVLEFVGRGDTQVKVRGFRVELGEVEGALRGMEGVREAVVVARKEEGGHKRLVAYVVGQPGRKVEAGEVRAYVKGRLPEYMVPAAVVVMEELPLTPNGKVDRKALPEPERVRGEAREYVAPRTPEEEKLAGIWAGVLGVEKVGVHDNFFELGGDSILSLQIIAKAGQQGLRITPKQLFARQTIAELAEVVSASKARGEQGVVEGPVPLTPVQREFFEKGLKKPEHFNQAVLLEVREALDAALLEKALRHVVEHHDALRMRFERTDSGWTQLNAGLDVHVTLGRVDLSGTPDEGLKAAIESGAARVHAGMELSRGPLFQAVLFELGAARSARLLLVAHHLVVDAVSWRVLLEDLQTAYQQLRANTAVALPEKTTSFKRWAERLETYARSEEVGREAAYWRELLSHEVPALPVDRAGGANTVGSAREVKVSLGEEETRALLQEVPGAWRASVQEVLLAGLARGLSTWTGKARLRVEVEGHGREELFGDEVDITRTVGWFTAVYPVELEVPVGGGAGDALRAVKETLRQVPGKGVGYGLVRYLREGGGAPRGTPRAQVAFNYLGQLDGVAAQSSVFAPARESSGPVQDSGEARGHVLEVNGYVLGGRLELTWTYSENLHARSTIDALAASFLAGLRELVANRRSPDAKRLSPSDFPLAKLSQEELEKVLRGRGEVEDVYPLSPMQQGMLFHVRLAPETGVYFEQLTWSIRSELESGALRRAWEKVVSRHPALRTAFLWEGLAEPVQVVEAKVELPWREEDWRGMPAEQQQRELEALLEKDKAKGLELSKAPLMRLTLVRLADREYRLVWSHSHLSLDGWSLGVVLKDLFAQYEACRQGRELELGRAPRFSRYVEWLGRQKVEEVEGWWKQELKGFREPTPLPAGKGKVEKAGEVVEVVEEKEWLTKEETERLQGFARKHQLTLNTLAQAAWALVLGKYAGQRDVVFGATASGRPAELEGVGEMVGLFINSLPVRVKLEERQPVVEWLRKLQEGQAELRQREFSPLVQVQSWSEVPRGAALFESLLVFENYPLDAAAKQYARGLEVEAEVVERTNYPLTVAVVPGERVLLRVSYEAARMEEGGARRVLEHWKAALEGLVEGAEGRLGAVSLLRGEERRRVLEEWNQTGAEYPRERSIGEEFEERVKERAGAVALECGEEKRTYGELEERANQIAHYLRGLGVGADERVGLCVERSAELVEWVLGIVKAGGAYVPLDPAYPRERLAGMLEDARPRVVVTEREQEGRLPLEGRVVVVREEVEQEVRRQPKTAPRSGAGPRTVAYVDFTSGSTGRPKGVLTEHRGVLRTVKGAKYAHLGPEETLLLIAPISFDASTLEVWGALLNGARLVVYPRGPVGDVEELERVVKGKGVTVLHLTAGLFTQVVDTKVEGLRGVRQVLTGGDVVSAPHVRRVLEELKVPVTACYGPTENTLFTSCHRMERVEQVGEVVAIGRPIGNTRVYVLDEGLQPVPVGVVGELYTAGEGLARGYLEEAGLTAEKFMPDPYGGEGERMYRTGDMARWRKDGVLEFVGRGDTQVKVRGFRVELGEVEGVVRGMEGVREAVVVARKEEGGLKRLVAYVVGQPGRKVEAGEVRAYVKGKLPEYMVPAAVVVMEELPLTPNGKVDRKALPAPDSARPEQAQPYVAPRTDIEQQLARMCAELLGVEKVGLNDDFIELGGHSLLATRLVSRIRTTFGVDLSLRTLFESPTVASIAVHIVHLQSQQISPDELSQLMAELEQMSGDQVEDLLSGPHNPTDNKKASNE